MTQDNNDAGALDGFTITEGYEAEDIARRQAEAAQRAAAKDDGSVVFVARRDARDPDDVVARLYERITAGGPSAAFGDAELDDAAWLRSKHQAQFMRLCDDLARWFKEHGSKLPKTEWAEAVRRREREERQREKDTRRRNVEAANDGDGDLPVVLLGFDHERTGDQCIEHLGRRADVYQRNSALVRIVRAPGVAPIDADASPAARRAHDRAVRCSPDEGAPVVEDIPIPSVSEMLSSVVEFRRRTEQGDRRVNAPDSVAARVVARRRYDPRHVRVLHGVLPAPCMLPSGEIITSPGYHRSGYLLDIDAPVYLPERPTRDDARASAARMASIFSDYQYQGDVDRQRISVAAMLAAIITPLAHIAIGHIAPAFMWDADKQSAGKTLAATVCGAIVLGRRPSARPWSDNPEETRKAFGAIALNLTPVVFFDNLITSLTSAHLALVITSGRFSDRLLGAHSDIDVPWNSTVYLTANDPNHNNDIEKRTRFIRLVGRGVGHTDGGSARYKHPDLLAHALENRLSYLSDALTILKAHTLAGRPEGTLWGGFEEWSRVVSSAILWSFDADPALAGPRPGSNIERNSATAVVGAWCRALRGVSVTLSDLKQRVAPQYPATAPPALVALRDQLADLCNVPDFSRVVFGSLGKRLARFVGRDMPCPWGGTMKLSAAENRNGSMVYTATCTDAPPLNEAPTAGAADDGDDHPASRDGGDL